MGQKTKAEIVVEYLSGNRFIIISGNKAGFFVFIFLFIFLKLWL